MLAIHLLTNYMDLQTHTIPFRKLSSFFIISFGGLASVKSIIRIGLGLDQLATLPHEESRAARVPSGYFTLNEPF